MALSHSPQIVTRNLLLNLDFGNIQKCYNGSENLFTYSEQFDNAAWTSAYGQNAVVTANAITSPDGTSNADLITFTPDGTGQSRKEQNIGTRSSGTYTVSVFVKRGTISQISLYVSTSFPPSYPSIAYNFGTDTITNIGATGTRTFYPDGWIRLTATATVTSHTMYPGLLATTSGTLYAWGAQVERGQTASPYVQTVASTVTRPTTATSTISNYSHTINQPQYISYDGADNSIRFDRNETFANFTGSITSNVLTVTAMSGVTTITNGSALSYSGLTPPRYITSFGTGIGTTGTYNVNAGIDTTSRAMTSAYKIGGNMVVTASGSLASNTYLYNDHTTEVWAKINDRTAASYDSYEGESVLVTFAGYHSMFLYGSTYLKYYIWDNTGPTSKGTTSLSLGTTGTDIIQGQWFHVVVTKFGSTFRTYLNGVLKYTDTITSTALSGVTNNLRLGGAGDGNTGAFYYYAKNNIGCLKMYNTILSADEIKQNFNALRGRFGI